MAEQQGSIEQQLESPRTGVPWRARDIVFGILAGFGGAFAFFILYALIVRVADGPSLSEIGAFSFASVVTYGFLFLGLWFFALRRNGASVRDAGLVKFQLGAIALMLPVTLAVLFANLMIQYGIMAIFGEIRTASDQLGVEQGTLKTADVSLLLLATSVVAPLVEEFLFRGLLFRTLRVRRGFWGAATISAAIFAVSHFIPLLMPSLFFLGLALAWATERYGSLYPPIALHAFFNAIATIALASSV